MVIDDPERRLATGDVAAIDICDAEILTLRCLENHEKQLVFSSENESPPFRFQAPTDKTKHET